MITVVISLTFLRFAITDVYLQSPIGLNSIPSKDKTATLFNSQNNECSKNSERLKIPLKFYTSDHKSADSVVTLKIDPNKSGVHWTLANASILVQYRCRDKAEEFKAETDQYGMSCKIRGRTLGLYTADRKLGVNPLGYSSAMFTRQNPLGFTFGNECTEERDYYPYWRSSPWIDAIYLTTDHDDYCNIVVAHSNQKKFECLPRDNNILARRWNSELTCLNNGAKWVALYNYEERFFGVMSKSQCKHDWDLTIDSQNTSDYHCFRKIQSRLKCLEWDKMSFGSKVKLDWTIPKFAKSKKCQLRISSDYDTMRINSTFNHLSGIYRSPILNDPNITLVLDNEKLVVPVNLKTSRVGTVFEDRSIVFIVKPRPEKLSGFRIRNVNIDQTSTQTSFVPKYIKLNRGKDIIHFQWSQYPQRYNLIELDSLGRYVTFNNSQFWLSFRSIENEETINLAFWYATGGQYSSVNEYKMRKSGVANEMFDVANLVCIKPGKFYLTSSFGNVLGVSDLKMTIECMI